MSSPPRSRSPSPPPPWVDPKRPPSDTMEGMIVYSNEVLDKALESKTSGGTSLVIPSLIVQKCRYVALLSMSEVGLFVSKRHGTGLLLANLSNNSDSVNNWSPPCAISLDGIGFGLTVGVSVSHVLFFIMDDTGLKDFLNGKVTQTNLSLAVGPTGEVKHIDHAAKGRGSSDDDDDAHSTYVYAFSKGFFPSLDVRTANMSALLTENHRFYGLKKSMNKILQGDKDIEIPKNRGVEDLFTKLDKLRDDSGTEADAENQRQVEP